MAQFDQKEAMRKAALKLQQQKEEEERKDREYFERITTGRPWLIFKIGVAFCTLMLILTSIDIYVDGKSKKLKEGEWRIDRELYMNGHQSIKVGNALFIAPFEIWFGHIDDSFEITYSLIFQTGKKLAYNQEVSEGAVVRHEVIRRRSIFTWFPFLQIAMVIPLLVFIFKRKKPWFRFARTMSLLIITPMSFIILMYLLI